MVSNISWLLSLTIFVALVLNLSHLIGCQDDGQELYKPGNSSATRLLARLAFSGIGDLSAFAGPEVIDSLKFCINDLDAEWNAAFNFSSNLEFLDRCVETTKGDLLQRLCTVAEIKFYLSSFTSKTAASGISKSTNFLKPNNNCNLTSWVSGCEPGWTCALPKGQKIDLKNSNIVPVRNLNCQPCCEGFFCPHGITCMIPCPLGAYCPLAKFNETSGVCDPYHYQLPPHRSNHTCGGADIWADILRSTELFCSAGSYCPSTIQKIPCSSGHYCRTGSTSQTRCFRLVACESKTEKQNITAFGILLFAGLILLLLIIYNCSDQVLTTRERRQARSRESGARSARENAEANERWASARETARKMQSQISRTFSRKRSERQLPGMDAASLPMPTSASQPKGKKRGPSNLTQMMQEIEENPDSQEGFNMEIGDKNLKKNKPKQMQTRTQIFKYAYGQIEKEKAMQEKNKDLTYSGIISMGNDIEVRTRPTIEVAFKDLTLTLKSNGKHIMRCVTGKIVPGHVSAVMGPSGAGKTTFLSALAGKIRGCNMSGMILINGKNESIHSYKKIIGFVPQDDIVHGNLTVEENLWFSARCRLSAHLPKPEKVLVVERVIESLGLQHIRDSLVGTVEKRGISGGQKKRVNVGLEMVMEPSLLILDEPTSGLDSSSSLLLLRALRREALEGVNICMVLHQPSYTLYKMFDDLVLLAKGGLTVYHGSVRKAEEYFAGMGIHVPERINPPDYFIDILEGIVKPSSGVNYKDLPLRWLLHNGYRVPPDMLNSGGLSASATGENSVHETNSVASGSDEQSFAGDLLKDVKSNVEVEKDNIHNNFLKSTDLSNRVTPGVFHQYKYFLGRVGKQRLRESRIQAADFLILLLAGICLGTLAKVSDETFGALGYTYTVIAVSLLVMIAALRSFSLDKLHYWRESASGMSSLAYFLSKDTVDHFNTIIKPVVYLSMFYFFNNPRSSFLDHYIVLVCMVYFVTGMAYILAIYLEPGPAQLWSVLLPVVFSLIAHQNKGEGIMGKIENLCYSKWTMEAFVIANAQRYSGVWLITRCGALLKSHYHLDDWTFCLRNLIVAGVACRVAAYLCLIIFQKK